MKIYNHNNQEELLATQTEICAHIGDILWQQIAWDYFVGMPVTSDGISSQLGAPRWILTMHISI